MHVTASIHRYSRRIALDIINTVGKEGFMIFYSGESCEYLAIALAKLGDRRGALDNIKRAFDDYLLFDTTVKVQ